MLAQVSSSGYAQKKFVQMTTVVRMGVAVLYSESADKSAD